MKWRAITATAATAEGKQRPGWRGERWDCTLKCCTNKGDHYSALTETSAESMTPLKIWAGTRRSRDIDDHPSSFNNHLILIRVVWWAGVDPRNTPWTGPTHTVPSLSGIHGAILEFPSNLMCLFLNCGRKDTPQFPLLVCRLQVPSLEERGWRRQQPAAKATPWAQRHCVSTTFL